MFKEFIEFLREYKIVSLSIAFIVGVATTNLVQSLVNNIIMPFITPLIDAENWRNAVLEIGPISIEWGAFAGEVLSFLVILLVVFLVAKKILREEKVKV